MKKLALFAAHFTPSNLAPSIARACGRSICRNSAGNRSIVTTHQRHYEEQLDWEFHALVPTELRVVRVPAIPTNPCASSATSVSAGCHFTYAALAQLAARARDRFLAHHDPSKFSALLGRMIHRRHGYPVRHRLHRPWVHEWPGSEQRFSKAWTSARLATLLEPWAVRDAALITGVAPLYYDAVLERNPQLRGRVITAAMPYGGSERDFESLRQAPRPTYLFDANDGTFHIVYAGAMLPKAYVVLERLLGGLRLLRARDRMSRTACGFTSSAPASRRTIRPATTWPRTPSASASRTSCTNIRRACRNRRIQSPDPGSRDADSRLDRSPLHTIEGVPGSAGTAARYWPCCTRRARPPSFYVGVRQQRSLRSMANTAKRRNLDAPGSRTS